MSTAFPRGVPATYPVPTVTIDRLLDDAAQDAPDANAVLHQGRGLTWRQVHDQVDRLATALQTFGVGNGQHAIVALPRTPQALVGLFALWRLHAIPVLMDADAPVSGFMAACQKFPATVVVIEDRRFSEVSNALPQGTTIITTGPEDVLAFPRNLAAAAERWVRRPSRGTDRMMRLIHQHPPITPLATAPHENVAAVFFVDGDVHCFSHSQLLAGALHLRLWIPDMMVEAERVLSTLPAHVPLGLTAAFTMPALAAATTVLVRTQEARRFARAAEKHDPTVVITGHLPSAATLFRRATPALRVCLQAGPVEPELASAAEERTGARVRGWWAPPTSAGVVLAEPVYGRTKPHTVGMAVTDTHAEIRSGELWIRGPQLAVPGWHHAGRVATIDEDGFVTLAD